MAEDDKKAADEPKQSPDRARGVDASKPDTVQPSKKNGSSVDDNSDQVTGAFWGWASARNDAGEVASRSLLMMIGGVAAFAVLSSLALMIGAIADLFVEPTSGRIPNAVALTTPILLRGGELFLTLAAALLVFLIILTRNNDAILSLLGVVIIAAIIIPTGDLIRLGSVFGMADGDREAQSFRASSEGESVSYDRSAIFSKRVVARAFELPRIVDALNRFQSSDARVASRGLIEFRRELDTFIANETYLFQLERLESAVRNRGIARLLVEVVDSERARQMTMMPATIRAIRPELIALRDLGLVSASQADFANLAVTALGIEVACRVAPDDQVLLARIARDRLNQIVRARPTLQSPDCRVGTESNPNQSDVQTSGTVRGSGPTSGEDTQTQQIVLPPAARTFVVPPDVLISETGFSRPVDISRNATVAFDLTVPAGGELSLVVQTSNTQGMDPILEVRDLINNNRLAYDDDSAGGFDAFLVVRLLPGRYSIRVRDFGSGSGSTTVSMRRANTEDEIKAITGREERLPGSLARFFGECPAGLLDPSALLVPPTLEPTSITITGGIQLFQCQVRQGGIFTFDVNSNGRRDLVMAAYRQNEDRSFTRLAFNDDRRGGERGRALDPLIEDLEIPASTTIAVVLRDLARTPQMEATLRVSRR